MAGSSVARPALTTSTHYTRSPHTGLVTRSLDLESDVATGGEWDGQQLLREFETKLAWKRMRLRVFHSPIQKALSQLVRQ